MQFPNLRACPNCGGDEGYRYDLHTKYQMTACGWDDEPESDGGTTSRASKITCLDCGATFTEKRLKRLNETSQDGEDENE